MLQKLTFSDDQPVLALISVMTFQSVKRRTLVLSCSGTCALRENDIQHITKDMFVYSN